jgi:hypothetical protein
MLLSPLQREAMQSFINSNSPLNHYVTPESVHRRLPQGDANLEPRVFASSLFSYYLLLYLRAQSFVADEQC